MRERQLMQTFDNTGSLTGVATILADYLFGSTEVAALVRQIVACSASNICQTVSWSILAR